MRAISCFLVLAALPAPVSAQEAEKQVIFTISGKDLRGGVVSEVAWDGTTVVVQGVFADRGGTLAAQYFVKAADGVTVERRAEHTPGSLKYWETKSNRVSPTGLGRVSIRSDTKLPQYGIGSLERRMGDAVDMGGTLTTHTVRVGDLVLLERVSPTVPYDGETWSWSPAELNRIAYTSTKGVTSGSPRPTGGRPVACAAAVSRCRRGRLTACTWLWRNTKGANLRPFAANESTHLLDAAAASGTLYSAP